MIEHAEVMHKGDASGNEMTVRWRLPSGLEIFGLCRYIKTLKKLIAIARKHPGLMVLPAHRYYYDGRWNQISLEERANELLQDHIERYDAIIAILNSGPKTAAEIAATGSIQFETFIKNLTWD